MNKEKKETSACRSIYSDTPCANWETCSVGLLAHYDGRYNRNRYQVVMVLPNRLDTAGRAVCSVRDYLRYGETAVGSRGDLRHTTFPIYPIRPEAAKLMSHIIDNGIMDAEQRKLILALHRSASDNQAACNALEDLRMWDDTYCAICYLENKLK